MKNFNEGEIMIEKEIAWIDSKYRHYRIYEITDEHLLKIIEFISNGGGYDHFLTKDKIANLLKEAFNRGLIRTE